MKLLICFSCGDIFNLVVGKEKSCSCGESKGQYVDELNAEIQGNCEPIGFENGSFIKALKMQRLENKFQINKNDVCCIGVDFHAFIIPDWAKSIKRIK